MLNMQETCTEAYVDLEIFETKFQTAMTHFTTKMYKK